MKKSEKMSDEQKRKIGNANKISVKKYYKEHPEAREYLRKLSTGKKYSLESRLKRSINNPHKGKNHHSWKGGITTINEKIRKSIEYKIWRRAVYERDNYTCIWCGARSEKGKTVVLNADHIKPFALFPELRFAIDNGRTLCIDCHKTTESYLNSNL